MFGAASWTNRLALRGRFPLLLKDLTEMAARKRTYVVRVVYAALLFGIYGLVLRYVLIRFGGGSFYGIMGCGEKVFKGAVILQFSGLFLFLPAMMSSAITSEREREALPLILLTDLRPWEILMEKYLGRMVPMAVFLLLGMPLVALAYSLGGFSLAHILIAAWFLFITLLQIGALSLMISAYCRTSVSAFISAYVALFVLYVGPPAVIYEVLRLEEFPERLAWMLCPPSVMVDVMGRTAFLFNGPKAPAAGKWLLVLVEVALRTLPILLSTSLFLVVARYFLLRRADAKPGHALRSFMGWMDRVFMAINSALGGVFIVRDRSLAPIQKPVYWRETTHKALGRFSYLLRILVAMEVVLFIICILVSQAPEHSPYQHNDAIARLSFVIYVLWLIAAFTLVVRGADAVASERSAQTLEVLLSTPLDSREIVREKMRAVRRLAIVAAVALLTVICKEAYERRVNYRGSIRSGEYLLRAGAMVLIYLPMFYWLGLFIGGKMRSRAKAIVASLIALTIWCVAPIVIYLAIEIGLDRSPGRDIMAAVAVISPATVIVLTEASHVPSEFRSMLTVGMLVHLTMLSFFRSWCLWHANRILGRPRERSAQERAECAVKTMEGRV